jgi:hypothetical protein
MEVKFIEHKNKRILYVDYRGAKNENDMLDTLKKDVEIEKTLKDKTLLLANFENAPITQKYMDEVKRSGVEIRSKIMSKTALIGITGIKNIFVQGYIRFTGQKDMKMFNSEDDAKEWLVS